MGAETIGGREPQPKSTLSSVYEIVSEVLNLEPSQSTRLNRSTSLIEDLDADSLALIETVEAAEARFGVRLADDERLGEIKNLGDVAEWIDELRQGVN